VRQVVRTTAAEQDLDEILGFLLDQSDGTARRFVSELDSTCRLLAAQPGIGRPRDDLAPGVRSRVVGHHVLFYRATDDGLTVLRIIHGSRDIPAVFGDPG
jgi:toxin ParE1/3/4